MVDLGELRWQMHCLSLSIFLIHLANDLDEGLGCYFYLPIPLGVIGQQPVVFDLIELQHLSYLTVDKWCAIVIDDAIRYFEPNNYVFLDKICHGFSCGLIKWYGLCPFGEVLHNYNDPYVLT